MWKRHRKAGKGMNGTINLGGYATVAKRLIILSERGYTRQAVEGLYKRRSSNGFPEIKTVIINGFEKHYFDLDEIDQWFPEWNRNIKGHQGRHGIGKENT